LDRVTNTTRQAWHSPRLPHTTEHPTRKVLTMRTPTRQIPNPTAGGEARRYEFSNGYGASVVCHSFSYGDAQGLWELAVLITVDKGWDITYDTPITDDVIGWLAEDDVDALLDRIEALPAVESTTV